MQYMGGKTMIAKHIVQAILRDGVPRDRWFEPFVGGANVLERAAPIFDRSVGMDAHPDLILMWQAGQGGWAPPDLTRERYAQLRRADPSPERGFAGFGASFGGKWFAGYGVAAVDKKHPNAELWQSSLKTFTRQSAVFRKFDVRFQCRYFGEYQPPPGTVVYCDPPYSGTTEYTLGEFDHDGFFRTVQRWVADGCHVYISEYTIPDEIPSTVIWERSRRNALQASDNRRTVIERLFRINPA